MDVCDQSVMTHEPGAAGCSRRFRLSWRSGLAAALAFSGIVVSGLAGASESTEKTSTLRFEIPKQPLAAALQAYTTVSGVAVLYASGTELGRQSAALDGEYTREDALKRLLCDSGLVPRYARSDAIALVDPTVAATDDPPDSPLPGIDMALDTLRVASPSSGRDQQALSDYISVIQQDIQQALKKGSPAGDGSYRVGIDLWVDPTRTIRRTQVFHSTGDPVRDSAVASVLEGIVIRRAPPARTPQPVRVMIVVRPM